MLRFLCTHEINLLISDSSRIYKYIFYFLGKKGELGVKLELRK